MNVYDFDKTIYNGDSTLDFYKYVLKRQPGLIRFLPWQLWNAVLYAVGAISKTRFKEQFFGFLKEIKQIDNCVKDFWGKNENKIKFWYSENKKDDDVIVSASPEFLLIPICEKLGIKNLVASKVDKTTGAFSGENCYGEEKVRRIKEIFPEESIDEFYSDSISDRPLAELAINAYFVTGSKIENWHEHKETKKDKLKRYFLSKTFLRFSIIGTVNTLNNIIFSTLLSMFIQTNIAFIIGYILSLTIGYILNSVYVFQDKITFNKYMRFCISYLPNFIIQNMGVILLYNIFGLPEVLTIWLATVIAVPVTFLLLNIFTFGQKKKERI